MGRLASYDSSESGGSEGKGSKEDNSFNEKQKHIIKGIQGLINYNTNQINKCIMDIKMKLSEINVLTEGRISAFLNECYFT